MPPAPSFKRIGLISPQIRISIQETLQCLSDLLPAPTYQLSFFSGFLAEQPLSCQTPLPAEMVLISDKKDFLDHIDILFVIGGDGSLLQMARWIQGYDIPVVGINKGKLGFLADLNPHTLSADLPTLLSGDFYAEKRCLLEAFIKRQEESVPSLDTVSPRPYMALNEIGFYNNDLARVLDFDVFVDDYHIAHYRADGLLIATPTGSTAHALAAGGPIVHPTVPTILLVPICPHRLHSRPLLIPLHAKIRLSPTKHPARMSCDGQSSTHIAPGDEVCIASTGESFTLLHPASYNYYQRLQEKLGYQ